MRELVVRGESPHRPPGNRSRRKTPTPGQKHSGAESRTAPEKYNVAPDVTRR